MYRILCSFLLIATTFSPCLAQDDVRKPSIVQDEPSSQSLSAFRRTLIKAAEESQQAGDISRVDLFKIRVTTLSRPALVKMQQAVIEQAIFEGKLPANSPAAAIDWTTLLQFIKEALPIILEIIKLLA